MSTGSDAMTWCNDALEHFLQKMYISVQMLDLQLFEKKITLKQDVVTLQNVSVTCIDILHDGKSPVEIYSMNGCTFSLQ